jgi:glycosyltransferase involved in cell wall biosynthesis
MFEFIKYTKPAWYYCLAHKTETPTFIDSRKIPENLSRIIELDREYRTETATLMDAAYQALQKGVIPVAANCLKNDPSLIVGHIPDNYRFIKKYFGVKWSIYILVLRIATLNNPIRETGAFLSSIRVPKGRRITEPVEYDFEHYSYDPAAKNPLVSIVIPTLNRYEYLKDVFQDLTEQTYKNFEVLICDQSVPFDEAMYAGWPFPITLIRQEEKALWMARNRCIQAAKGSCILLFDDDSRVSPDWILMHLKCIAFFNGDISAGVTDTIIGGGMGARDAHFHLSDVFDTGNAMVSRRVFEKTGLFDRQFEKQRMGDGEFGLRAYLAGYQVISNPYAKRIHLKVESGGLREMGSWDAFRPKGLFAPRPIPSVLYFVRKYFGNQSAIYLMLIAVPPSIVPYKYKGSKLLKIVSLLLLPFFIPIILFQIMYAWKLSTKKLTQGFLSN